MIAKSTKRKGGSSLKALANYIADPKKADRIWTMNCSEDPELAVLQMAATQDLNTRSKSDKTYHLIISFAKGDIVLPTRMREIEKAFADKLGFTEHQRLIAVHRDTDYLHMHIAISKIHPRTLRNYDPHQDHRKLQDLCRELEIQYKFQQIEGKNKPNDGREAPIKYQLTFADWLKQNIREPLNEKLKTAKTWDEIHEFLGAFGVELRANGAGLVFSHCTRKLYVKVGSIDRAFSKSKYEKQFGEFSRCSGDYKAHISYQPGPRHLTEKTGMLYEL